MFSLNSYLFSKKGTLSRQWILPTAALLISTHPSFAEGTLPVPVSEVPEPAPWQAQIDYYRSDETGDVWGNTPAWQLPAPNGELPQDIWKYGLRAIYLAKYACQSPEVRDWMPTNIANGVYYCTNPEDKQQTVNYLRTLADRLWKESNVRTSGLRADNQMPAMDSEPTIEQTAVDYYRDTETGDVWGTEPAYRFSTPSNLPEDSYRYGLRALYLAKYACQSADIRDWMPTNIANGIYYCTNPEDREQTINYLLALADKLESDPANSPPVANSLSVTAHAYDSLQINLIGSDADGDTLVYELLSPASSDAYYSAYIQGNVLYVEVGGAFDSIGSTTLEYRVTDGQQFSPSATVTLQASTGEEEHGLGLQLVDTRTYSEIPTGNLSSRLFGAAGSAPVLPRQVDLSDSFPIPGAQGQQNSCVGWATAYALKSYQERMEEGWTLEMAEGSPDYNHIFSPAFIYNQINGGQDEGSDINTALQLIVDMGVATLVTMPYNESDYLSQPSGAAFEEAAKFRGAEVKRADSLLAIKEALANRLPVVAGIAVYNSLDELRGTDAVYNNKGSGTLLGGHAVTIVGYDDDKFGGAFKIINSWGRNWGDNGYFWLPYDFAEQPAPWPDDRDARVLAMSLFLKDADNTGTVETPVLPPPLSQDLPNLQVETWTASYDARPGGSGELQYSIVNTGTVGVAANTVDVNLMLSTDSEVSSNDIYVVYETITLDIGPGESVYRDENNPVSFYLPTIPAGTYYMGVWVDDLNQIQESNENDNFSSGEQMVTMQDTLPDLVVRTWYAEWDDSSGDGALEYEVVNEGMSPTTLTDWDINLVLSSDEIIGNGDEWVLFFEQGNYILQPGDPVFRNTDNQAYFNLYIDAFGNMIPSGIYYMAVWVDDQNREPESDEYNNSSLGSEVIFVGEEFFSLRSSQKRENYNGKPLPRKIMLRKVQLIDTPEGKRQLRSVEEELEKPIFDKQQRSADQVVFPTARRVALPKEPHYGHGK